MPSRGLAFVIMPFGHKKAPGGTEVNFDAIYAHLFKPAIESAGLQALRPDADRSGGSVREDMFGQLLQAEFVLFDLTLDNPNVWYEIGVRHALRASGSVFTYTSRDRLPFDIPGRRVYRYTLVDGKLDEVQLPSERRALGEMISAALEDCRGRRSSSVFRLPMEPARVILFSGHMIDNPTKRGPGKAKPARFPPDKIGAAAARVRSALDEIGANAADLGLCGGACGGDLLFAEACLERGMRMQLYLARSETEFMEESVIFSDPGRDWERRFIAVAHNPNTLVFMPEELGPTPEGLSAHDRCNRSMLYSALSHGLQRAWFIALWNGEPGDGPGGTEHMVGLFKQLTGRQPIVINPATL